jgi:hypothetical protein
MTRATTLLGRSLRPTLRQRPAIVHRRLAPLLTWGLRGELLSQSAFDWPFTRPAQEGTSAGFRRAGVSVYALAQALFLRPQVDFLRPPPCQQSQTCGVCPAYFPPSSLLEGQLLVSIIRKTRRLSRFRKQESVVE